jgi:hypothetical protein
MMISVGSAGGGDLRELNQLQADKQANVINTRTLTLALMGYREEQEPITQREVCCNANRDSNFAPARRFALQGL